MTHPNDASVLPRDVGASMQDPNRIADRMADLLRKLLLRYPGAGAIGLSGQMHGIVYVDSGGQAVSPLYTWQDGRANWPMASGETYVDSLQNLTGYAISSGFGLATHYYHVINGQVPPAAATFCTIADYVAMRLTGAPRPVLHPTMAASLGLFDVQGSRFDEDAGVRAGISPTMLPPVCAKGTVVGRYEGSIPVFHAIGDNQASFFGAALGREEILLINVGTGAQLSLLSADYRQVAGWETRPFFDGRYLLVGAAMSGGKSYALVEAFFRDVLQLAGSPVPSSLYARMDEALASHPLTTTLQVEPMFYGSRNDAQKRGTIGNLTPDNFTAIDLMVGVLTGIVDELHEYYQKLPQALKEQIRTITGAGNGIRKNRHLVRLIERRFASTVTVSPHEEEAAFGAALYAAVSASGYPGFGEIGIQEDRGTLE